MWKWNLEGNQTTGKISIDGWIVLKKTAIFKRGSGRGEVKTEIRWKTPMENRLNKPNIELGCNHTTRKTSIDAQTVLKKTVIFKEGVGRGGVKTEIQWKIPIGNRSNKPYMEVEGNQTTRKTSIDADCFEVNVFFFFGGGLEEGWGAQNWNPMKNAHGESFR